MDALLDQSISFAPGSDEMQRKTAPGGLPGAAHFYPK
jgi:hypothetical protein